MNESLNMPFLWPKAEPGFSLSSFLQQYLGLALVLLMAFFPAGCLVDNDQFDEARRDRDKYMSELKAKTEANTQLNLDITRIYNDYSVLSTQLALTAAISMHDRYTEGLSQPRPAAPPPPPVVSRPSTQTRPARPPQAARPRPERPATQQPPSGGQTQQPTTRQPPPLPSDGQTSGGAATPPSPQPSSRPSGSVDWGL